MHLLLLSDDPCEGLERILAYIEKTDKNITVERKRASQWLPADKNPFRIIVHVEVPCRLAIPYGGYNVLAVSGPYTKEWAWIEQNMNMIVHNFEIETSLPHLPAGKTIRESVESWRQIIHSAKKAVKNKGKEKATAVEETNMSIVTVMHDPIWWPNMVQNIMTQTMPMKNTEWVIVDDTKSLLTEVSQFQRDNPELTVRYLESAGSIGHKRNTGIAAATNPIILFMDSDDHYPETSVKIRINKLLESGSECIYCATLPVYDIQHYVSSLLGPSVKKLPHLRASEATMCFRKDFWRSRPFVDVKQDEGQEFLKGRELETQEISPNGIIVAFLHKGNPTARFGPQEPFKGEPNGCHYGFSDKYFKYIHQVGMSKG